MYVAKHCDHIYHLQDMALDLGMFETVLPYYRLVETSEELLTDV